MKKPLPTVVMPPELEHLACPEGDDFLFEELMTAQPEATQAYFRERIASKAPRTAEGE